MACFLAIAGLIGARCASGLGLTFAGDLELVQVVINAEDFSKDESGRTFFTHADVSVYPNMADREAGAVRTWMLVLEPNSTDEELERLTQEFEGGQQSHPNRGEVPVVEGRLTEDQLRAVLNKTEYSGRVKFAEEDTFEKKIPRLESITEEDVQADGDRQRPSTTLQPSQTVQSMYPWNIQSINADVVRGRGVGVNVYVLDTGIRTTHVLFGGRAFAAVDVAATGFLSVCAPGSTTCAADQNGHGTHCAGTVGAATYGVADGATIWAVKVLDDSGSGFASWSILAQQWVLSSGVRPAVVSMSLGGAGKSLAEQASLDFLVADGVTVVVAAGNQNQDACNYNPAWIPSAITVASYGGLAGSSSEKSYFSNYGTCIDVWAPGSSILSTYISNDASVGISSGTSMACPHVAGLAAIMYELYPSAPGMTASERWDLLTASNRTEWVTGIPTTPATVNLVALAPVPTTPPTPSPTYSSCLQGYTDQFQNPYYDDTDGCHTYAADFVNQMGLVGESHSWCDDDTNTFDGVTYFAYEVCEECGVCRERQPSPAPTPAPTPAPSPGGVSGVGDPHLTNVHGEHFDLYRTGVSVLLQIPRAVDPQHALLRLEADARRLGTCADVYFQVVSISGAWAKHSDSLQFFAGASNKPNNMTWTRFGKIDLKVVNARTREGIDYLNVFARHLGKAGYEVGGLLGEDDHGDAITPSQECTHQMALVVQNTVEHWASSEASVAEASIA